MAARSQQSKACKKREAKPKNKTGNRLKDSSIIILSVSCVFERSAEQDAENKSKEEESKTIAAGKNAEIWNLKSLSKTSLRSFI